MAGRLVREIANKMACIYAVYIFEVDMLQSMLFC